jgi:hypothetical protein
VGSLRIFSPISFLVLVLCFWLGGQARAQDFIACSTPNMSGNQNWGGNLGLDFDVHAPIILTQLGTFNHNQGTFAATTRIIVALWSRTHNGTTPDDTSPDMVGDTKPLATMAFYFYSPGSLTGNYAFKPLDSPLTLPVGSYTLAAYGYNNDDLNGNENNGNFTVNTDNGGGLISFVGTGRFDYPADAVPAGGFSPNSTAAQGYPNVTAHVFGAGSFQYRAAGGD